MYPPQIMNTLRDALASIYWYKSDLRRFVQAVLPDLRIVSSLDWNDYKFAIAAELVDSLTALGEQGLSYVQRLLRAVMDMKDFSHLSRVEDGRRKAAQASALVESLRVQVMAHTELLKAEAAAREARRMEADKATARRRFSERMDLFKTKFLELHGSTDVRRRGYELEKLVHDLLELHDLDPGASFRNRGEQTDGSFTLDGIEYLLECKWIKDPVSIQDLDAFGSKVKRNLQNTLGLFLSVNGFSRDGVLAHSLGRPCLLLMDGADLLAILEERIDFRVLLQRKRRRAAEGGGIYYRVSDMLNE